LHDEQFIEDESWPSFNRLSGAYKQTRERLVPMLAPREREIMQAIDRLDGDINDLNRQVSVLFLNGSRDEASKVLLQEVLPKTAPLLSHLSELTQSQRMDVQKALLLSSSDAEESRSQILIFSIIAVLVSLTVTFIAIWYGRKLSGQLQDMNAYLEQKIYERTESLLEEKHELIEDNNELTRMALTDSLTGLSNRTHMNQILHKEYSRFERHNQRFGIIMLDIDHFKQVNDSYGHDIGDSVLKKLANIFENAIRTSDFIARWGGEEFLICCTTIVSHSFGRSTFGLLLPAIEDDLGLSHSQGGLPGTGIYVAYIVGVLAVAVSASHVEPITIMKFGLATAAIGLLMASTASGLAMLTIGVALAGGAGAGIWLTAPVLALVTSLA